MNQNLNFNQYKFKNSMLNLFEYKFLNNDEDK